MSFIIDKSNASHSRQEIMFAILVRLSRSVLARSSNFLLPLAIRDLNANTGTLTPHKWKTVNRNLCSSSDLAAT